MAYTLFQTRIGHARRFANMLSCIWQKIDSSLNSKLSFQANEYNYKDNVNVALNGIHKSAINKIENGIVTVNVDATIYDYDFKSRTGTIYLYFKKITDR